MELNWSTFVLEIINFLVLVWLLKHFLYKPVRDVIARRQAGIEKTLTEADAKYAEAKQLQQQYESRLADWEQERRKKREALQRELDVESRQQHEAIKQRMQQEQEKAEVASAKRLLDQQRKMEETAMQQAARFAAKLLKEVSGPDTEARLIDKLIADLTGLPAEQKNRLSHQSVTAADTLEVCSAYPIADTQKRQLQQALVSLTGEDKQVHFNEDKALIAGIRIRIGSWLMHANIDHELSLFAELSRDE